MNRRSATISMSILTFLICCSSLTTNYTDVSDSQSFWKQIVNRIGIIETRAFDVEGVESLKAQVLEDEEGQLVLEKAGLESYRAKTVDYSIVGKFVRRNRTRAFLMLAKTDGVTNKLYLITIAGDNIVDGMEVSTSENSDHPNLDSSSFGLPLLLSSSIIAPVNDLSSNYRIHQFFFPINNHTLNDEASDIDWHEEAFVFGRNGLITRAD